LAPGRLINLSSKSMGYRFQVDRSNCLNCGVCMDVCPVHALDMTRTLSPSIESGVGSPTRGGQPWMMEFPIQSGECIGCELCSVECPTAVIQIDAVDGPAELVAAQGPIRHGPESETGWAPLTEYTTESLRELHTDP
jgi:ferredoxin